jgi:hypothetical protein
MNKKILSLLLVGVAAFSFAGCSEDDKDDAFNGTKNVADDPELVGTFSGDCAGAGFIDAGVKDSYKFEGNSFTRLQTFYADNRCADGQELGVIMYEGEFTIDEDSDQVTNGGSIDIKLESAKLNIQNQTLADLLNAINFCGQNDYGPNSEVALTRANTDAATCPVDTVPSEKYGAYTINNGKLYLNRGGLQGMSVNADERPTEVLKDQAFNK